MAIMEWINEQIFILMSTYYYEVFLYKGNVQIARLVQAVRKSNDFIIDSKRKMAWHILNERGFIKGHKIILHFKLDYGLPLTESIKEQIHEINSLVSISETTKSLSGNFTKEQVKNSEPISLIKKKGKINNIEVTEENLPPTLIYEIYDANFVKKALSLSGGTDWSMVIIACIVAIIIVVFMIVMVFGLK